jgi:hypothetical protein
MRHMERLTREDIAALEDNMKEAVSCFYRHEQRGSKVV